MDSMGGFRFRAAGAAAYVLLASAAAPPAPSAVVREDWYFRETLPAIDAWERIIGRWEEEDPAAKELPLFPVPSDGTSVLWPNPIPLPLLPFEDKAERLELAWAEGKVRLTRTLGRGAAAQERAAAGAAVRGYAHPGGGGHDHWYHGWERAFDRLTSLRPTAAPFGLALAAPLDLARGANALELAIKSCVPEELRLDLALSLRTLDAPPAAAARAVTLPPLGAAVVELPVALEREGGALLLVSIKHGATAYTLPLLAHVEWVSDLTARIGALLAETPDAAAARELAAIETAARAWTPAAGRSWRAIFERASALRDRLLLGRIGFDALLFLKRKPFDSEQPFMDAHHLRNRPGGGIYRLSPVRPDGAVTAVVDSLGEGVYRDLCLHWDAGRLLFSFGNGSDAWDGSQSYHIYETDPAGTSVTQLTFGPRNDCEPFYLPFDRIGFTSDRSGHYVMCGADRHAPNLFVLEKRGAAPRPISLNVFNDINPSLLPDGRIIYSRWEYNERSVTSLHNPFTINPDGSMMAPYYGNATLRPNVIMFPRAVPGGTAVTALFTGHHGQTHGAIGRIEIERGVDGPDPLAILTPGVPITGEKIEDSRRGWFSDPWPLSEDTYLCAFTPTVLPWLERGWALYIGDRRGTLALLYRDPAISCAEPVPLAPRAAPHPFPVRPPREDAEDPEARLLVIDVYEGLPGVPRGAAAHLRIIEDLPRTEVTTESVITTAGTGIYTIKRVLGTVPVAPDGSANFLAPADRNIYFEVLDARHREIQRMRSVVCLKPGEIRACVGCHEPRTTAPPNRRGAAWNAAPARLDPPPWGTAPLSYLRDIQPILNARCAGCHTHDRAAVKVILTDDLTNRFTIAYEELLPYLSVADAMRWDHPDDVYPRPPYTYGSAASRLTEILESGHHGVLLSPGEERRLFMWIDANAVYYDRYATPHYDNRQIFTGKTRERLAAVYGRRCADCHGETDGHRATWWLSLNHRDLAMSRMLQAPLAAAAGGWGRCDGTVFATGEDADYQAMRAALRELYEQLRRFPREDLASLSGASVPYREAVPPPPPPRRPSAAPEPAPGGWVYLSDLPWISAAAGWSFNDDKLPRRDRDVEGRALRSGAGVRARGIGTHAPSEIAYALDGAYARFRATAVAAEKGGTVVFKVLGDGRELFASAVLRGAGQAAAVDVPLDGVAELRLVVTDAGDGYGADMANWIGARLQARPPANAGEGSAGASPPAAPPH